MKQSTASLKERWKKDFSQLHDTITIALKYNKDITKLYIPLTADEYLDLRGYSAPKQHLTIPTRSGKSRTFPNDSIRIKGNHFVRVDFSQADFECCEFINCSFDDCIFNNAKLSACNFIGCTFNNITFSKTNFRDSSFYAEGVILITRKKNFSNIIFNDVKFTEVHFTIQHLENCQFSDCSTTALMFNKCKLHEVSFTGSVKDIFLVNCQTVKVDFTRSEIEGISLKEQKIEGISFPSGDAYYLFTNKSKELAELDLSAFTPEELSVVDVVKQIWMSVGDETTFADINYLPPGEIEVGKKMIALLKNTKA